MLFLMSFSTTDKPEVPFSMQLTRINGMPSYKQSSPTARVAFGGISVGGAWRGLVNVGGNLIHRVDRFFRTPALEEMREGRFHIYPAKFIFPLLALGTLVYEYGNAKMNPEHPDAKMPFKLLGGAALAHLIIQHTSNVLPLIALGTATLQAGFQDNLLTKIQDFSKTLILFGLTALGVAWGRDYTFKSFHHDTKGMLKALNDSGYSLESALKSSNTSELRHIGGDLTRLRSLLETFNSQTKTVGKGFDVARYKSIKQNLNTALKALHEKMETSSAKQALEQLFKRNTLETAKSRYTDFMRILLPNRDLLVRLGRESNPVVFGLLIGSLAGLPVANMFNRLVAKWFPKLSHIHRPRLYETDYPPSPSAEGHGGGHGEHGANPFLMSTNPYQVMWNNDLAHTAGRLETFDQYGH